MKINMKPLRLLFFVMLFSPVYLSASEFGFLLFQEGRSKSLTSNTTLYKVPSQEYYYAGKFSGWFSARTGKHSAVFAEGSFSVINESLTGLNSELKAFGELDRLEFSIMPHDVFFANIGRVPFKDALGFVADGNFDGGNVIFSSGNHIFSGGAFYTGLLYKETAKILMSNEDREDYVNSDYFAPGHYLFSIGYDYSGSNVDIGFNVLRQADIHKDVLLQSFYLLEKFSLRPTDTINININTAMGVVIMFDGLFQLGFAPSLSVFYMPHGIFPGRLGFETIWYSGNLDNKKEMPVITRKQIGYIYNPELTNLLSLKAQYLANLTKSFSFETSLALFARTSTDLIPNYWFYSEFENAANDNKYLLGEEFVFTVICSPVSDLSFNIGTGLFFPDSGMDNVYSELSPVTWDIRLGLLMSF
jgi:hypothetical protein